MYLDLIEKKTKDVSESWLYIIDENIKESDIELLVSQKIVILTNRFDIYERLQASDLEVFFNDFDLSVFDDRNFSQIFYRVSKEKAVTHHIIDNVERLLCDKGKLILCGRKNDGIKSYAEKAAKSFGSLTQIKKNGSIYLGTATRSIQEIKGASKTEAHDKNYTKLRACIPYLNHYLVSKPGIFGWEKIDNGSKLLGNFIADFLTLFDEPPQNILDLGCGYGYLSALLNTHTKAKIIATDNNAAAILACAENFSKLNINGEVIAGDCAQNIKKLFDAVICNPPFHKGFVTDGQLTKKFAHSSYLRLRKGGMALFVVNCFIPLEKYTSKFLYTKTVAKNKSYKLILLVK